MITGTTIKSGNLNSKIGIALFLILFGILSQIIFSQLISKRDRDFLSTDFPESYHVTAVKIVDGDDLLSAFYTTENSNDQIVGQKRLYLNHPPGYPIFIALSYTLADILNFERVTFLKFVETIAYGLSALILFFIFNLFYSYYDSIFGAMLWIMNPLNLWLTRQPHSEIPFFLFFFLALFFFFKMRTEKNSLQLILFSICVAITIFIRSASLFLPLLCLLVTLLSFKTNKNATFNLSQKIGIVFIPYLLISPWITFISIEQKAFVPMATSGQGMMHTGLTYLLKEGKDEFIQAPAEIKDLIIKIDENFNAQTLDDKTKSIETVVIENFIKEPYTAMKLLTLKLFKSTHATFSKRDETKIFLFNFVFFILVSIGCFLTRKNTYLKFSLVFVIYSFLLCIMTFPKVQYMLPAFGLFSVYVSISLRNLFSKISRLAYKS